MIKRLSQGHWPIFLLSSLSSVGNLFLPIVLVRILTPEEMGTYKSFFIYLSILPFLVMAGGPLHSVYYWAGKPKSERAQFFNASWTLSVLLSGLILLVGMPLELILAQHLHVTPLFMVILLMSGFAWTPSSHYSEASIALGRQASGAIFDTVFELIKVVGFIVIAQLTHDLSKLFEFFAVVIILKLFIGAWLNRRYNHIHWEWNPEAMKEVLHYSFPIAMAGCLSVFVDKFDLLLLAGRLETRDFAYYSLGCLIIPPLYLLEMSVQKMLIPQLSRFFQEQEWALASAAYRKAISDIAYLMIPAMFGLLVFARPIVIILFTRQYLSSVPFLQIFALSYLLLLIPHDSVARATGQTRWILKMYLVITPLSLLITYLVAGNYGAQAVLITTLLIKVVPKLMGLLMSVKTMHWRWGDLWPLKHLTLYVSVAAVLSLVSFALEPYFGDERWWFGVCALGFALCYLSITHLLLRKDLYAHR